MGGASNNAAATSPKGQNQRRNRPPMTPAEACVGFYKIFCEKGIKKSFFINELMGK